MSVNTHSFRTYLMSQKLRIPGNIWHYAAPFYLFLLDADVSHIRRECGNLVTCTFPKVPFRNTFPQNLEHLASDRINTPCDSLLPHLRFSFVKILPPLMARSFPRVIKYFQSSQNETKGKFSYAKMKKLPHYTGSILIT